MVAAHEGAAAGNGANATAHGGPPQVPGGALWARESWRQKPADQQVDYEDPAELQAALKHVRHLPPLISLGEVTALHDQLAEVAQGRRFLLQGGDCAERFLDCQSAAIEQKLKIMLQMSLVLTWGARVPTVRVARMAGQFAISGTAADDGGCHPFLGDHINSLDRSERTPDPDRLVQGYFHSAATLNYARALIKDGFADVRSADHWNLGFVRSSASRAKYEQMVRSIHEASDFMQVCGLTDLERLKTVDLFVSHETVHLEYEEAMTRRTPCGGYFNAGAHFLWIGEQNTKLEHAHVEYMRGLLNPIGIKVGPSMEPHTLVELILRLCPNIQHQPGKVTLITRFGADRVEERLPPLVQEVTRAGMGGAVVWCCDPMHGNTRDVVMGDGDSAKTYKTRDFEHVLRELRLTFEVHSRCGSRLGGAHLEMTGERVTECLGGPEELQLEYLPLRYTTYCHPRLNYAQSLEIAFMMADYIRSSRARPGGARLLTAAGLRDSEGQEEQVTSSAAPCKRKLGTAFGDEDTAREPPP